MGNLLKRGLKSNMFILLFVSTMLLSIATIGNSINNKGSTNVPLIQFPNTPNNAIEGIRTTGSLNFYKEFSVTENTGSDQTNVIIDPVIFTEEQGFCYKDSIRLYKSPYNALDELKSQVYNVEQHAWETFCADTNFGKPTTNWEANEFGTGKITVLPRYQGFKKVVELYDPVDSVGDATQLKHTFSDQTSGTVYVTWWVKSIPTGGAPYIYCYLWENNTARVEFAFGNTNNWYYWNTSWFNTGVSYQANTIYTIKMIFDCSIDKFNVSYWNEATLSWTIILADTSFCNGLADNINNITIGTNSGCIGTGYVAAVDTSWASGFEEDRILYLKSAEIAFIDDLQASETKTYRLYYDNTPTIPAGYTDISRTGYAVNFTDGSSITMYHGGNDLVMMYDKNQNMHISGSTNYEETNTDESGGGSMVVAAPLITDGTIFIEAWHIDSASEWSLYRYYANSYMYKYHNYSGSGRSSFGCFARDIATWDFDGAYYHQSGSWQYEAYDYTGISWLNHWETVDAGKMFAEDTGDPNTLIVLWDTSQDPYANQIMISECNFPNPASARLGIGRTASYVNGAFTNNFGAWQFFQDVGSTNISDKQDFVDNLYDLMFANPPTISSLGARNGPIDGIKPNILEINVDRMNPGIFDLINITVHVTDNTGISTVRIYTDLFGSFQYYDMNLVSGNSTNGYWSYETRVPLQANGKIISYSIWVNDTSGLVSTSGTSQFTVKYYPIIMIFIPGGGGDGGIVIIIVIASVAAAAIGASTYVIKKHSSTTKMKKSKKEPSTTKTKAKTKKGMDLGADEIRRILAGSEKIQGVEPESYRSLKNMIIGPLTVIPRDIYLRVLKIKHLTDQEKEALLDDLAGLDDEQREKWLQKVEGLEDF